MIPLPGLGWYIDYNRRAFARASYGRIFVYRRVHGVLPSPRLLDIGRPEPLTSNFIEFYHLQITLFSANTKKAMHHLHTALSVSVAPPLTLWWQIRERAHGEPTMFFVQVEQDHDGPV